MLTQFVRKGGEFVNMFTSVFAVWNAEAELEVKCLEEPITKKVSFNHPEIVDWFVAHNELHSAKKYEMKDNVSEHYLLL